MSDREREGSPDVQLPDKWYYDETISVRVVATKGILLSGLRGEHNGNPFSDHTPPLPDTHTHTHTHTFFVIFYTLCRPAVFWHFSDSHSVLTLLVMELCSCYFYSV